MVTVFSPGAVAGDMIGQFNWHLGYVRQILVGGIILLAVALSSFSKARRA